MEGEGEKRYSIFLQGCRKEVTARHNVLPTVLFNYHCNKFADLDQSSRIRMGIVQHKPLNKIFEGVSVQWATAMWAWMFLLGQYTLCLSVSWVQALRIGSRTHALGPFQGAAPCGGSIPRAKQIQPWQIPPLTCTTHKIQWANTLPEPGMYQSTDTACESPAIPDFDESPEMLVTC